MTLIYMLLAAAAVYVLLKKQQAKSLPLFHNPAGSPVVDKNEDPAAWRRFFWERMFDRESVVLPEGFVVPQAEAISAFAAHPDRDSVSWLGHASFLIRLDGFTLLTDPWLSERASPFKFFGPQRFSPPGISVENLPPVDVLLISHNHYDHLDVETLRKLPRKDRMTVVTPTGNAALLRPLGFKNIVELGWEDAADISSLKITVLPAIHFSARSLWDRNRMLWGGFSIEGQRRKLYFSGDTTHGDVFKTLSSYGPFDIGMIGIGAYAPEALMRAAHATPEQAIEIAKDLKVKTVIGMHWGSVRLTEEPSFEPPERFRKAGQAAGYVPDALWVMNLGENRTI